MAGKLGGRASLNAVTPGALVHVEDDISKRRFLCDTGASYSIFPHHSAAAPTGPALHGPAGRPIKCWGEKELTLSFNKKQYKWIFLLAEVQFPILGIDLLRHFSLMVDAAAGQLIDTRTMAAIAAGGREDCPRGGVFSAIGGTPPEYRSLLVEFQDVLNPSGDLPPTTHGVEHHIITTGRLVTARFRRLDPEKYMAAKAAFAKLERVYGYVYTFLAGARKLASFVPITRRIRTMKGETVVMRDPTRAGGLARPSCRFRLLPWASPSRGPRPRRVRCHETGA